MCLHSSALLSPWGTLVFVRTSVSPTRTRPGHLSWPGVSVCSAIAAECISTDPLLPPPCASPAGGALQKTGVPAGRSRVWPQNTPARHQGHCGIRPCCGTQEAAEQEGAGPCHPAACPKQEPKLRLGCHEAGTWGLGPMVLKANASAQGCVLFQVVGIEGGYQVC